MRKYLLLFLILIIGFIACGKTKTNIPRAGSTPHSLRNEFNLPLPLPVGEQLTYEVKVTRFPIYATAGEVTFEYLGTSSNPSIDKLDFKSQPEQQLFHFRATAISRGLLVKLFGISVNDRFETLVDRKQYKTQAIVKEIEENKKHSLQTGLFDYERREANYRTIDLNKPENPPKQVNLKLENQMLDLLAAFYFIRLQDLKENTSIKFPLIFDAERAEFDLLIHDREEVSIDLGKFKTIKIEPKLFGPGRLINKEGEMFMWLTDDEKHLPVKVTAKVPNATISAELIRKK